MPRGSTFHNGSSWGYVFDLPRADGVKRRQERRCGWRTELEAERALTEALLERGYGSRTGPYLTLEEFLVTEWLPRRTRSNRLKPGSLLADRNSVLNHIVPALGSRYLSELTTLEIMDFYDSIPHGSAPRSVRKIGGTLTTALNDAVRWGFLAKNPAAHATKPSNDERRFVTLSERQSESLLKFWENDDLWPVVALALSTGLRRGEILGLRHQDLDPDRKRLTVRKNLTFTGGVIHLDTPKTKKSHRVVPLTNLALSALARASSRQAEARLARSDWPTHDLVFTRDDGQRMDPNWVGHRFRVVTTRWADETGHPRPRFHDLRHTFATQALGRGLHIKRLSEMLGHSSVEFTMNRYVHIIEDDYDDMRETLEGMHKGWEEADSGSVVQLRPLEASRRSGWSKITNDQIREALATARSTRGALLALGLSSASKHYERLEREARRLGLELPRSTSGRKPRQRPSSSPPEAQAVDAN